jgi:predicted transcriptional regulator
MLKRHLLAEHQMTPDQYRVKWDLAPTNPIIAADYAALRSKVAKDSWLGKKVLVTVAPKKRGRPANAR